MQICHKWIAQQLGAGARSGDVWRYCHNAGRGKLAVED